MKPNPIIILAVAVFVLIGSTAFVILIRNQGDFLRQFQSFAVTIDNQAEDVIISKETFRPRLSAAGEAAVYLEYTNSAGETFQHTVCGYTESLTGYSEVAITDEETLIDQQCW